MVDSKKNARHWQAFSDASPFTMEPPDMVAKTYTLGLLGIDAFLVEVEVDISTGLPSFATVGLPDSVVRESRDRIKAAIQNSGYPFPMDRVTVNLAPAHMKKEGSGFDLPIAAAILAATGLLDAGALQDALLVGELSLDGQVRGIVGTLPMAVEAQRQGRSAFYVPSENVQEAAIVQDLNVYGIQHLSQLVELLAGRLELEPQRFAAGRLLDAPDPDGPDLLDVKGQEHAKRALEVAAAGSHNLLLIGPPGSGKTMLSQRLPSILPPLSFDEALQTSKIYSVAGLLKGRPLITRRPFRNPHHTISDAGLIGGGHIPRPGEVSLAHNGVLFLDEFPEFRRNILDLLRQPLEDGRVTIARANMTLTYPASFMLVAAMNPCPCGYAGDPNHACRCSEHHIHRYRSRISGPILDRIDLHVEVPAVRYEDLKGSSAGESSEAIRRRVVNARQRQLARLSTEKTFSNAAMAPKQIQRHCRLDEQGLHILEDAIRRLGFSARAYHRILKVSRTIADLEDSEDIRPHHVLEAIQYRSLDRDLF